MAVQLGYEAWVKGDPKTKTLGDCEFCNPLIKLSSVLIRAAACRPVLPPRASDT